MIRKTVYILIFILFPAFLNASNFVPSINETLVYEVSYMGIKLGTIKIVTEKLTKENGKDVYETKAYIDSYKGIPFVDIHVIYDSFIDKSFTFSHKFFGNLKSNDYWDVHKIFFNYDKNNIYISKENKDGKYFENSIMINKKNYHDGLSLFFLARKFLQVDKQVLVPTIIDKDTVTTKINFKNFKESINIDKVSYPIKTVYFDGIAYWTGVYGLSGEFEGWFSDDEARIPIRAKMKLYLGSVNIELINWKRNGWQPPK